MNDIRENLAAVRGEILTACRKAGRSPGEVRLIAVTKMVDAERVRAAADQGVSDFGENYLQEARGKIEALGPDPRGI